MARTPRGSSPLALDGPSVSEGMAYARRVLGDLRALKDAGVPLTVFARETGLSHATVWWAWKAPPRATRIDTLDLLDGAIRRIRRNIEESANNPTG